MFVDEDCVDSRFAVDDLRTRDYLYDNMLFKTSFVVQNYATLLSANLSFIR